MGFTSEDKCRADECFSFLIPQLWSFLANALIGSSRQNPASRICKLSSAQPRLFNCFLYPSLSVHEVRSCQVHGVTEIEDLGLGFYLAFWVLRAGFMDEVREFADRQPGVLD